MSNNNQRIVFLDWLRIFSFVSVLIGHKFIDKLNVLFADDSLHVSLRELIKLCILLCGGGGAGVVVFFLVSGYVITCVLQKEESFEFFIKRIFRIYPLYIAAVLFQTLLLVLIEHIPVNFSILIPQLLLVGDFFHAPLTLNGVEWTLRVEILFYFLMFFLRYLNVMDKYEVCLPWILIFITLSMNFLPPIPGKDFWNIGYLNIYSPFLFLGVFFFLYENKRITLLFLLGYIFLVFVQHWNLITVYAPVWRHAHFAVLALVIYISAWNFRELLTSNVIILFLSDLTYSMYLFHNWLFDRIKAIPLFNNDLYALIMLVLICWVLVKAVEKPGIMLGKLVYKNFMNIRRSLSLFQLHQK